MVPLLPQEGTGGNEAPEPGMPEADGIEKPKRKPGRPAKKRHDPEAAPVNGDYERDVVFGKEPGKRYAWLDENNKTDSDVPRFRSRGYRRSTRQPDGPRPAWDMGAETDTFLTNGALTLYEVEEETAARFNAREVAQSERRMKAIHEAAAATGGYMTHKMERANG